eukprot:TRINITY_DN11358_c0_g1_i2.p1 TRINITY_DN11358_c0_g1~~TRINITY_DN11358_c0_g1_i2.p1  ORF type:complete len:144 (-),score=22.01 TRINITY_DN11358_c0_g1_i2:283-714(-)
MFSAGGAVLHAPDLEDIQDILIFKPSLRELFTGLQRPVASTREALETADDIIYLADFKISVKIIGALAALTTVAVIWWGFMMRLMGSVWLAAGTILLLSQAPFLKTAVRWILAAKAVATRPKSPWPQKHWFEDTRTPANGDKR